MSQLVLSLFPGIGLLDRGFEDEGFCVVRGPDLLWGGDVRKFNPPSGRFDGVIGGPPCQAFSSMRHIVKANGFQLAENLIPEFARVVTEAQPEWFLMENVPDAPSPDVAGWVFREVLLDNRSCPETPGSSIGPEQQRLRRFTFGSRFREIVRFAPRIALFENPTWAPAVMASGGRRATPVKIGGSGKIKPSRRPGRPDESRDNSTRYLSEAIRLQGLPADFDLPPFTVTAKIKAVGNGVPYPLARAVARAVREAIS